MIERTFAIIKPDAVFSGWGPNIIAHYQNNGLRIVKKYEAQLSRVHATEFYREHEGKHFFAGLVLSMTSGPSIGLVLEGKDAINRVRALNGATDPKKADQGTIRREFLSAGGPFNTVHGSDSPESAEREINLYASWDDPASETEDVLQLSVNTLEISVRSRNCLSNANITTIGALVQKSEAELLKTKNFGRKSMREIVAALTEMNLSLRA